MLFDWMVAGQVLPVNPAYAVRGPKHSQSEARRLYSKPDEARTLIDAIDAISLSGLRDRALIGLMVYTFARVGAAISMKVEDFYVQGRRGWVRLHEKGGKEHEMPTHRNLDRYLEEYIAGGRHRRGPERLALSYDTRPIGRADRQFPASAGCLEDDSPASASRRVSRRDRVSHLLRNGNHGLPQERGRLEIAQQMAAHESARTTGLYDWRNDEVSLYEVGRIGI